MRGHQPWAEIRNMRQRSPESEARIAAETRNLLRENALYKMRRHEYVSQQELDDALGVPKAQIEHEREPQISTLRRFVEALGGE